MKVFTTPEPGPSIGSVGASEGVQHKWRYATRKAVPNRLSFGEHPDHRFGYRIRTDLLVPHNRLREFSVGCSCGWKDSGSWSSSKRYVFAQWEKHVAEALKQQELFKPNRKENA